MYNAEQKIIVAVKNYLDVKDINVRLYPDPKVPGTYAIRANDIDNGEIFDFLYCGGEPVIDFLEEVEYKSWPPKSL